MPRSNRPRRPGLRKAAPAPEADLERARSGIARRESAPDGDWMVRTMTARNAEKTYVCPGCSRGVPPGIAHLVVWKEDHIFGSSVGLAERRHWHTNCWQGRTYRYR